MISINEIKQCFKKSKVAVLTYYDIQDQDIIIRCDFFFIQLINSKEIAIDKKIEMLIDRDYPSQLPRVYEYGEKTIKNYIHLYSDELNTFCLGTDFDLHLKMYPSYNFSNFLEIIAWFLVDEAYYSLNNEFLIGDRGHFQKGIKETYIEFFSLQSIQGLKCLWDNFFFSGNTVNNKPCFCGSGKKYKYCHQGVVNIIKKNKVIKSIFIEDMKQIGVKKIESK